MAAEGKELSFPPGRMGLVERLWVMTRAKARAGVCGGGNMS